MRSTVAFLLATCPALAGVVFEVETTDHDSPPKTETVEMAAEGRNIKIGIASGYRTSDDENYVTILFMGRRVVIHRDKLRIFNEQKKEHTTVGKEVLRSTSMRRVPKRRVVKEKAETIGKTTYTKYAVYVGKRVVRRYWTAAPGKKSAAADALKAMSTVARFFPAKATPGKAHGAEGSLAGGRASGSAGGGR